MFLNWIDSTNNRIVLIRLVITTLLFGSSAVIYYMNGRTRVALYLIFVIAVVYLLSLIYLVLKPSILKHKTFIDAIQIFFDIVLSSIVIIVTGGIGSPFIFLFALIVIYTNIIFSSRIVSYGLSFLLAIVLLLIVVSKPRIFHSDKSYEIRLQASAQIDQQSLVSTYFNLAGFLLAAVLSGYLSERARLVRQELGQSEKSLNVLKNLNDNILKSLDSGVITLDLKGIIISVNRMSKEILNLDSDEELLNIDIYKFFPGLNLENLISTKREQILYTTKSGHKITLGFSSSLLQGDDDETQGYILIFQDLTEIKILEDKLKNSEKLAILGQLASGLAHELRNPLSAISGAIEILSSEVEKSSDNQRLINVATQEMERMNLIVEDFSILTNPIQKAGFPVDISVILNETIDTFSKTIKRSDIDVERDIESEIYVSCDRYRLKQSFWNLFLNSMQSISGDGLIKVEAFSERQSVIIKISDSGCGISQKNISNIFDPFFTTKNSGTGLGLVIVQKVIESYNGKIDVVSAVDEGTTFIITMEKVSINAI